MPITGHTLPPPQYDHPPTIPVIEHVLSVKEVTKICAEWLGPPPLPHGSWWGCAHRQHQNSQPVCIVYRIDNQLVRRHELGHCNGWGPGHPTAKEIKEAEQNRLRPPPEMAKAFEEAWQRSIQRNGPPDSNLRQVLEKAEVPETGERLYRAMPAIRAKDE
jgi:hypothetical protein